MWVEEACADVGGELEVWFGGGALVEVALVFEVAGADETGVVVEDVADEGGAEEEVVVDVEVGGVDDVEVEVDDGGAELVEVEVDVVEEVGGSVLEAGIDELGGDVDALVAGSADDL